MNYLQDNVARSMVVALAGVITDTINAANNAQAVFMAGPSLEKTNARGLRSQARFRSVRGGRYHRGNRPDLQFPETLPVIVCQTFRKCKRTGPDLCDRLQ
jgi:hypothetical protein